MFNWYCWQLHCSPAEVSILWFLYKAALSLNGTITNPATVFRCECIFYQHKCLQLTQSYKSTSRKPIGTGPSSNHRFSRTCCLLMVITIFLAVQSLWGWKRSVFRGLLRITLASLAPLVVERCTLHASVPVFDLGVRHHIVKRLEALHHPEDAKHCLQREEDEFRIHSFQDFCDRCPATSGRRICRERPCFPTRSARLGWSPPINLLFLPMAATQSLTAL